MRRYELDYERTMKYAYDYLKDVNALSNAVLGLLKTRPGRFFTFLPENLGVEEIHQFNAGGKTKCLRNETAEFIRELISSDRNIFCVFDDFNASFKDREDNDLYLSNGFSYLMEIYYVVPGKSDIKLIAKCLHYSDAIWHSLCVITAFNVNNCRENIFSLNEIEMVCNQSKVVVIGSYDAEAPIYWEK